MNERGQLIKSLEDAITELKIRRDDPATSAVEAAQLEARIVELEARLELLRAQQIAAAANEVSMRSPDADQVARMRAAADELDAAVAESRETSAVLSLIDTAFGLFAT